MGRLPGSLEELIIKDDQHSPEAYTNRITYGWRGPYISGFDKEALLTDAWGNTYIYDSVPSEAKDCHHGKKHAHHSHGHGKGHYHHEHDYDGHRHYHDEDCTDKKEPQGTGQLISLGPDGTNDTADDLVYPSSPVSIDGSVYVTVHVQEDAGWISDPSNVTAYLYYSDNGEESEHPLQDSSPPFVFEDVPMGIHAVEVSRPGKDVIKTVISPGERQSTQIEVWLK